MAALNGIHAIEQRVRRRFAGSRTTVDAPKESSGPWFLDIELGAQRVVVEWRPDRGFGITSMRESGYGEGADEVYRSLHSAWRRLCGLLGRRQGTTVPVAMRLRELRVSRGLSQVQLAERLRVKQAAVSKIENRSDLHLQTLRDVVKAMGGQLVVLARFPEGEKELCFEAADGSNREAQTA